MLDTHFLGVPSKELRPWQPIADRETKPQRS